MSILLPVRFLTTGGGAPPEPPETCGLPLSRFTTLEKSRRFGVNFHFSCMDWSSDGMHLYVGLAIHTQTRNYRSSSVAWDIDAQNFVDWFRPGSYADCDGVRIKPDGTEVWVNVHTGIGFGRTMSFSLPSPYSWTETGINQPVLIANVPNSRAEFKNLNDMNINPEGTKMISWGRDSQQFPYERDMASAWDANTLSYHIPDNKIITASNCFIPKSGECLYRSAGQKIRKYLFGTPWELTTLGATIIEEIDLSSDLTANITSIFITNTRMFVSDDNDWVFQYNAA